MATPQQVIADPNFLALAPPDKIHVLSTIDPNFASLSPSDQQHVVMQIGGSVADKARQHLASMKTGGDLPAGTYSVADLADPGPTSAVAAVAGQFGDAIKGAVTGAPRAILDAATGGHYSEQQGDANPFDAQANRTYEDTKNAHGVIDTAVSAAQDIPILGPEVTRAKHGDLGGILGDATLATAPGVLPRALRGAGALKESIGSTMDARALAEIQRLVDPEGKFPEQSAPLARQILDARQTIADPKAAVTAAAGDARAAANAPASPVDVPDVWNGPTPTQWHPDAKAVALSAKADALAQMGEALPETKPLNAGPRLVTAGKKAAVGLAGGAFPGAGPVVHAVAGAGGGLAAAIDVAKLARDVISSPQFRSWKAGAQSAFGKAIMWGDAGVAVKTASAADMEASGIDDPAYGAIAHLSNADLVHLYNGGRGIYIDPDGKTHPLTLAVQP